MIPTGRDFGLAEWIKKLFYDNNSNKVVSIIPNIDYLSYVIISLYKKSILQPNDS